MVSTRHPPRPFTGTLVRVNTVYAMCLGRYDEDKLSQSWEMRKISQNQLTIIYWGHQKIDVLIIMQLLIFHLVKSAIFKKGNSENYSNDIDFISLIYVSLSFRM